MNKIDELFNQYGQISKMAHELESSEIIAYFVSQQKEKDEFLISYHKIYEIGKRLERSIPSLQVSCDMMSIDAFRCEFSNYVEMRRSDLKIKHLQEIYSRIQRYFPEADLVSKMKQLEIEEK